MAIEKATAALHSGQKKKKIFVFLFLASLYML